MTRTLALAVLVAALGCKEKKQPAGPPSAPAPAAEAPAAAAPSVPPQEMICDKVFPKSVRDKHFAGATVTEEKRPLGYSATCKVTSGDKEVATITITCHDNMKRAREMTLKNLKEKMRAVDLPGVGGGAAMIDSSASRIVSVWDDNSNCQGTLSILARDVDAAGLAKDLVAVWPAP